MEASKNVLYEAPSTTVVEVKTVGIVCTSPYGMQDYQYGGLDEG